MIANFTATPKPTSGVNKLSQRGSVALEFASGSPLFFKNNYFGNLATDFVVPRDIPSLFSHHGLDQYIGTHLRLHVHGCRVVILDFLADTFKAAGVDLHTFSTLCEFDLKERGASSGSARRTMLDLISQHSMPRMGSY